MNYKNTYLSLFLLLFTVLMYSCTTRASAKQETGLKIYTPEGHHHDYSGLSFYISKDPECGMSLSKELEDTATVNGKLYGFCSKECKDLFLNKTAKKR